MKTRIIQTALFSIALFVSFSAISDSSDFLVEMKIIDKGVELSTPSMLVKEGAEASMSITGEDHIAVGLVVNSSNETEAHVMAEVDSGSNNMSSELWVRKGEWTSVAVGELEFHARVDGSK